jgi:serine/threonine-protein kinase
MVGRGGDVHESRRIGTEHGTLPSSWAGELAAPESRAAFANEVADINRRRLRVLGPIMLVVHLVHVAVFWAAATEGGDALPGLVHARLGLMLVHCAMLPITGCLTVLVFRSRRDLVAKLMGPVVVALYLVHGALCTAFDLSAAGATATTYIAYCLGMAVILCIPLRAAVLAYGIGLTTLFAALHVVAPAAIAGLSTMPPCVTITAVGVGLASILHAARRRDFQLRLTIERQRDQLGTLNASLERRVHEQVGVIVARAAEVEQLNAQLQTQVRARSSELSLALAQLARQRGRDDRLLRGTTLGGRFVVGEVIGEGAMGAVHAGIDRRTGARVAIKTVQAASTRTLDALRRLVSEAGAAATINHPAVVRMIDVDISEDGLLFLVQELIAGETLARMATRAWNPGDAARLGSVLCDALAAAHDVGIVHRDVKPENVMLTIAAPGLKLLDFGIAKLHTAVHHVDAMTRSGMIIGTPAYMAPEQVRGVTEVSDRADVYAVGVILFRLLSERQPFEAASAHEAMISRLMRAAPSVREFQPSVPESLARLVARCLAGQPEDRPRAVELGRQLAGWADVAGAPRLEQLARLRGEIARTLPSTNPHHALASS